MWQSNETSQLTSYTTKQNFKWAANEFYAFKIHFKKIEKNAFLAKSSNFGFDARSIPVVIEPSKICKVFFIYSDIFEELQKFCKQKRIFEPPYNICLFE